MIPLVPVPPQFEAFAAIHTKVGLYYSIFFSGFALFLCFLSLLKRIRTGKWPFDEVQTAGLCFGLVLLTVVFGFYFWLLVGVAAIAITAMVIFGAVNKSIEVRFR